MAYSASKNWAIGRDDIIASALRKIGEYDSLDGVPDAERNDAATALNALVKEWQGEGIGLWLRQRNILILNPGVQRYKLGPTGTPGTVDDFHCFRDSELVEGTVTVAASGVNVTVDGWVDYAGNAASPPANLDVVGIRLANGTFHWTTANGAGGATSVTLTAGIPGGTPSRVGSKVYTYTTRITRPGKILYAYRENTTRQSAEVRLIGRLEYERLSLKDATGEPIQVHFDPQIDGTAPGNSMAHLSVWPVSPPLTTDKLVLVSEHYCDDLDGATDDPQFPIEWANALIWGLAAELGFEYGLDINSRAQIDQKAEYKKNLLLNAYDLENANFGISLDLSGRH